MARRRQTPDSSRATPNPEGRPASATESEAGPRAGTVAQAATVTAAATVPGRRRFVVRAWTALAGAAIAELAWVTGTFLRPRPSAASAASLFVAGPADRFEPGTVTAFPSGRFYLVRLKDGGFLALDRECTHLGCTVPWVETEGRFACPCHASAFDITGQVLNAPAPRPLDFYRVRLENGVVKVETSQRQRRTAFESSQVTVS
jgi:cytochrome b6-f complex iron-sulfur subunit